VGPTYITNAGFSYERANAYVAHDDADLVSFGRLFLANPDLPKRFANRASLIMRRFTEETS
jgi:2,4-dienoyl-CoA reductase-like NADH-dependent reductase (Old Yellow Enzyme family)